MRLPLHAIAVLALIGALTAPPVTAESDDAAGAAASTAEEPSRSAPAKGGAAAANDPDPDQREDDIRRTIETRDILLAIIAFGMRHARK